jgi:hypothetical protein
MSRTFEWLYNHLRSFSDIRDFLRISWKGLDKQESVLRLFANLRLFPCFDGYDVCEGNFNSGFIEPTKFIFKFFKQFLKDSGDKSDLTLLSKTNIIMTTSKNYQHYLVGKLDIADIFLHYNKHYSNYKPILCSGQKSLPFAFSHTRFRFSNPPYNASGKTATGNTLWQKFTTSALNNWIKPEGYLLFVHPSSWRKPTSGKAKNKGMFELMCHTNQMVYLEIHGLIDGQKTFNCGTRYDWYMIQKIKSTYITTILQEDNVEIEIPLTTCSWLPNADILTICKPRKITEYCPVLYSASWYDPRKKWMSVKKDNTYIYSCVQSITKTGIRYCYSSIDKGFFGISKVIIGESGLNNVVIDMKGEYGMTQGAMAIKVDTLKEAESIKKALLSEKFKTFIQQSMFSNFRIDWQLFTVLARDFWKDFV